MALNIALKQTTHGWTLFVNDVPCISDESFAVVDGLADRLRAGPDANDTSELEEVADSIRRVMVE